MKDINYEIDRLVTYSIQNMILEKDDKIYATNKLIDVLGVKNYSQSIYDTSDLEYLDVSDILQNIILWYEEKNNFKFPNTESKDLFDTKIMGCVSMCPSLFRLKYNEHYKESPHSATDFHYDFSIKSNYIRENRVNKDLKWKYNSEYGELDITVNLSKPEKDPKLIAQKVNEKKENEYPKCFLCKENEGFSGNLFHPARNNLRIIPIKLANEAWFMQYSPYVYYNEHCIVFNSDHRPMKINKKTFRRLLEFVSYYPHYTIGSNADLPIVGGSILSHDHYQGGNYEFSMSKAEEIEKPYLNKYNVQISLLKWPMSVVRLKSTSISDLEDASNYIFEKWIKYTDLNSNIISFTENIRHNTVTPIVRFKNGLYEVDLILRNNRTDEKNPYGIFHAKEEYHNIKKENIGLIECMGLAVLPSRLKNETNYIKKIILENISNEYKFDFKNDEILYKHKNFIDSLINNPKFKKENIDTIIEEEIGRVFVKVLEDCAVFKNDEIGRQGFDRFLEVIYEN